MMKRLFASARHTFAALLLILGVSSSNAQDQTLQRIGSAFKANLPASWTFDAGTWYYFDIALCFQYFPSCFGNNPSTPYAAPIFKTGVTNLSDSVFQLLSDEAVVVIFRTPPEMRYFAFTPYLMAKGRSLSPITIFASLEDSLSNVKLATTGSATPGVNVFNQYSAIVWTGDMNTFNTVKSTLVKSGLPPTSINFMSLPVNLPVYPLRTGTGFEKDHFQILMRSALPADSSAYAAYQSEDPFIVQKVGPTQHLTPAPAPTIDYLSEVSGVAEDPTGQIAKNLDVLTGLINSNYSAEGYNLQSELVNYLSLLGWNCIAYNAPCSGDNHDALYSTDALRAIDLRNKDDFVIVSGVNHQLTGKAIYLNHSVYDTRKLAGIVSVADPLLTTASALYHAGITDPADPRAAQFKNMYAYMISYSCSGRSYCLQIPPPTAANPVGLKAGAPFFLLGRSYVDPRTTVRPSTSEIVGDQVFVATKRR